MPSAMTFSELLGDSIHLHSVILEVADKKRCDPVTALDLLTTWHGELALGRMWKANQTITLAKAGQAVTVDDVLAYGEVGVELKMLDAFHDAMRNAIAATRDLDTGDPAVNALLFAAIRPSSSGGSSNPEELFRDRHALHAAAKAYALEHNVSITKASIKVLEA